jgi:hypothetical protein
LEFDDDSAAYQNSTNLTVLASKSGMVLRTNTNDGGGGDFSIVTGESSPTTLLFINKTSGNVGIGETNPLSPLVIKRTNNTVFNAADTSGQDQYGATLSVQNLSDTTNSFSQLLLRNRNSSKAVSRIASLTNGTGTDLVFVNEPQGSSPAERMRIKKEGQVIIPGGVTLGTLANQSSSSNTLDDYEEGTWTGRLASSSSGGTYYDSGGATGYYIKVGRLVHIQIHYTSTVSGSGGAIYLQGLPYAAQHYNSMTHWFFSGFSNLTAGYVPILRTQVSTSAIIFQAQKAGSASIDIPASHFGGGMNIMVSGTYITAS